MIDDEEADDHTIIQSVQVYNDEFIVDKIGEPIGAKDPRGACWDVPDYSSGRDKILTENFDFYFIFVVFFLPCS